MEIQFYLNITSEQVLDTHNFETSDIEQIKFHVSWYITLIVVNESFKKLFSIDFVNIFIFSQYFFQKLLSIFIFSQNFSNRFCPVEKCGFTPHCLYRDSLILRNMNYEVSIPQHSCFWNFQFLLRICAFAWTNLSIKTPFLCFSLCSEVFEFSVRI